MSALHQPSSLQDNLERLDAFLEEWKEELRQKPSRKLALESDSDGVEPEPRTLTDDMHTGPPLTIFQRTYLSPSWRSGPFMTMFCAKYSTLSLRLNRPRQRKRDWNGAY